MSQSQARPSSRTVPRLLAIFSIVLTQAVSGPFARGQTLHPAVRIAYVSGGNISILDEASGRRTRLTSDGQNFAPRWIAGGRALLFCRGTGAGCETWRWQPGRDVRRLRDGLWSPDGMSVAVTRVARPGGSATTVWIVRRGRMTRITPAQSHFRWSPLAWSPDSRRLALGRIGIPPPSKPGHEVPPTLGSLWVTVSTAGSTRLRRLPLPAWYGRQPGWPDVVFWSPDDRFLTVGVGPDLPCSSCRADGHSYHAIPVGGGPVIPLGTALDYGMMSWAPNAAYIVLSSPGGRETYFDKHLVRVDPTTGSRRALDNRRRWADIEPRVSPDGTRVAFARGRTSGPSTRMTPVELIASRHVWTVSADGTNPHKVTSAPGWTDEAPIWSPDGQWVFFVRWQRPRGKPAKARLWAVRADGGDAQPLTHLDVPGGFLQGFGYYGTFGWQAMFAVAP